MRCTRWIVSFLLAFALALGTVGSAGAASPEDIAAQAKRLAQDLQSGKMDMPTFQRRMMELQNQSLRGVGIDPAELERQRREGRSPENIAHLHQAMGASVAEAEDLQRWQLAHGFSSWRISFPSSLLTLIPNKGGHSEVTKKEAEIDGSLPQANVTMSARIIKPIPGEDAAEGMDISLGVKAVNPKWLKALQMNPGSPSTAAEELRQRSGSAGGSVRSFTWGAGLRSAKGRSSQGIYIGWLDGGSVAFELEIAGGLTNIGEMDGIAENLAAIAGQDCTWAALAGQK